MAEEFSNPFTPTFGIVPPYMAGREQLIALMREAFLNSMGDPNLATILIGARGIGKTALLSCIAREAEQAGWISVDVVAGEGMLEDIVQRSIEAASSFVTSHPKKRLTGIDFAQVIGLQWETDASFPANWRSRMNAILDQLAEHDIGLLITVDEVKPSYAEMLLLASTYQLFVREGRKVALVMAGLPQHVSALVSNEDVSFLRRARQHYLGNISDAEVEVAFEKTVESGGRTIDRKALTSAVKAIGGFPYMMQLVGYYIWEEAANEQEISLSHAERGIALAQEDFRFGVLNSTFRELSPGDRKFLYAMLEDKEFSTLSSIAKRLGKTTGYASTYKTRLLQAGVIEEQPGNTFAIAIPSFREYLLETAVK